MDLLPKIGGMDPYHGGSSQQRPGTGSFARKKKQEEERQAAAQGSAPTPPEFDVDPLLAEIDRMRVLDPALTDSGAHRALMALRAYHRSPGEVAPDDDDPFAGIAEPPAADATAIAQQITSRGFARRAPTPPGPQTGSDPARP